MDAQRVLFRLCMVMTFLTIIVAPAYSYADANVVRLIDVARPTTRPAGAPKYSDVCFSSRWIHPRGKNDPHDSLKAVDAFHATRLDWAYITDEKFIRQIKRRGLTFCPTTNSTA